jgi:fructokinase
MGEGSRTGVLVVGESLVDIVRRDDGSTETFAGGSAANVAVALARLGRETGFVTSYADDEHGRLIAEHLAASGVRLATDPHVVPRTSSALATLRADGSAHYTFDIDWRVGPVEVSDPPLALHACSLGAVVTPGCDDVRALMTRLRAGATTSYDINMRPSVTGVGPAIATTVEETVRLSDIVKASDEDLEALYPGDSEAAAAARLLALGPAAVVVTRGADGAVWYADDRAVVAPGVAVDVADTIGAGDTFGAAMLDELGTLGVLGHGLGAIAAMSREQVERVLGFATRAAAVTVSRPGADPPHRSELR